MNHSNEEIQECRNKIKELNSMLFRLFRESSVKDRVKINEVDTHLLEIQKEQELTGDKTVTFVY